MTGLTPRLDRYVGRVFIVSTILCTLYLIFHDYELHWLLRLICEPMLGVVLGAFVTLLYLGIAALVDAFHNNRVNGYQIGIIGYAILNVIVAIGLRAANENTLWPVAMFFSIFLTALIVSVGYVVVIVSIGIARVCATVLSNLWHPLD